MASSATGTMSLYPRRRTECVGDGIGSDARPPSRLTSSGNQPSFSATASRNRVIAQSPMEPCRTAATRWTRTAERGQCPRRRGRFDVAQDTSRLTAKEVFAWPTASPASTTCPVQAG
jgi:hypothetical protein